MKTPFCSELDAFIAHKGPAGIFTFNSDGELSFDLMRSRRLRADNEGPYDHEMVHCVLTDEATRWPQYALITSRALTIEVGQCQIETFHTMSKALAALQKKKEECYLSHHD